MTIMSSRKALDYQRGHIPEIHPAGDGVIFDLSIIGVQSHARLVIRCDADGDAWVSIVPSEAELSTKSSNPR